MALGWCLQILRSTAGTKRDEDYLLRNIFIENGRFHGQAIAADLKQKLGQDSDDRRSQLGTQQAGIGGFVRQNDAPLRVVD